MADNDAPRACMDPRGTVSRNNKEEYYTLLQPKYESSGPCGFGEDFFFMFSHDAPGAGPVWTPGARLAGFIKRTTIHCYTQNMKALGLVVLEKKIFYVFPIACLWELMTLRAGPFFDPRGMVGRIYKEDHYTLLHTKYESSGPCGFGEEDFFFYVFLPMTPPGRGPYGPQGHRWQAL